MSSLRTFGCLLLRTTWSRLTLQQALTEEQATTDRAVGNSRPALVEAGFEPDDTFLSGGAVLGVAHGRVREAG
jgi:hypothetical protein